MNDPERYFELNGYKIFVGLNEIHKDLSKYKLKPKEMHVLVELYKHKGETVSRDDLIESIWGSPFGNNLGLTQAVSRLRLIFKDDAKAPYLIKTIPKKGYQLVLTTDKEELAYISKNDKKAYIENNQWLKKIAFIGLILFGMVLLIVLLVDVRIRIEKYP